MVTTSRRKVEELLGQHAALAADLATRVAEMEQLWLRFAAITTGDATLPTLGLVERLDRLRSSQVRELHQAVALLHDLAQPRAGRVQVHVHDEAHAAVLLAPPTRRDEEAG